MSKKFILLTAVFGLVSFAGAFGFVWFTKQSEQPTPQTTETAQTLAQKEIKVTNAYETSPNLEPSTKYLTEQQLKTLVQELRNKMQDYDKKLENLKVHEQRLQLTQDILKQEIDKLNNLQIELTSITANIKSEQDKLLKSRIEIEQIETNNLSSIAATYDQMDSSSASIIIGNMCAALEAGKENVVGDSYDDAVKILHYMEERKKAKLLAELAVNNPDLAADLSRKLKHIVEVR